MRKSDVWIVVPAHNEEKHIGGVLKEARQYAGNIVIVDDGSSDRTYDIAVSSKVHVLRNIVNMGKGAAMRTGCDYAVRRGAKTIVVMDSDGQHKPSEIPALLSALNGVDIVFGCRRFTSRMPLVLKFGNMCINHAVKLLFGISIRDTQSGFRAFTSRAYRKIRWRASDYSVESEMIANAGRKKLKYRQVGISTIYHDRYKGTTMMDGIKIVLNMIIWRLRI